MAVTYYEHEKSNSMAVVKNIETGLQETFYADEYRLEEWDMMIGYYQENPDYTVGVE